MKKIGLLIGLMLSSTVNAQEVPKTLEEVQHYVNKHVSYRDDADEDNWQIPNRFKGYGDCEDFALLKRQMLIEAGYDENDLQLLLLIRTADIKAKKVADGHVVLYSKSRNVILDMGRTRGTSTRIFFNEPVRDYDEYMRVEGFTQVCVIKNMTLGIQGNVSERCVGGEARVKRRS